jgi:hypothetical protein
MAFLVSHTSNKTNPTGNSFVMKDEAAAADIMFRLEYNGAVGVTCRELSSDEYRAEKAKRLPPHLRHLAGV